MSYLTLFYIAFAYFAAAVFVVGFIIKIWGYAMTPVPLRIATTPAPTTPAGAALRVAKEVTIFASLFKSNKWTWLFGYTMHVLLAVTLIRHGLVTLGTSIPGSDMIFQDMGIFTYLIRGFWDITFRFALLLPLSLFALLIRRAWVDRTRYISSASDYAILLLLLAIARSGLAMKYFFETDVEAIHEFIYGLMPGYPFADAPSGEPLFLIHFLLVMLLFILFPFSKLMHLGGIFLSPTRNQADNPRDKRHINPWATV